VSGRRGLDINGLINITGNRTTKKQKPRFSEGSTNDFSTLPRISENETLQMLQNVTINSACFLLQMIK